MRKKVRTLDHGPRRWRPRVKTAVSCNAIPDANDAFINDIDIVHNTSLRLPCLCGHRPGQRIPDLA